MNKNYHIKKSFGYATEGLRVAWKFNANLRIHVIAAFVVLFLGLLLGLTANELVLIILTSIAVIGAEMINTVVEEVVNLVTKEHREEAKIAKDVAAGMVLMASFGSVLIGVLVFLPHLVALFK